MNAQQAWDWLVKEGYMKVNQLGLGHICKGPRKGDLAAFVYCIRTLGAYSVSLRDQPPPVQVSCGCRIYELRFKLRETKGKEGISHDGSTGQAQQGAVAAHDPQHDQGDEGAQGVR